MAKRVVVIASGTTEQRAMPYLLRYLQEEDVSVDDVLVPTRNKELNVQTAETLTKAVWYRHVDAPPDKIVILVDTDSATPDAALASLESELPGRLDANIGERLHFAYAQWHLEAWYFADSQNLRGYLAGKALGNVDTSSPDEIQNPKLHLKHILAGRVYTARVSEEIAATLDPHTIAGRSPSFRGFPDAVLNGGHVVNASIS